MDRNENERQEETRKVVNSKEPFSHEITGRISSPPVASSPLRRSPPPRKKEPTQKFIKPSVSKVEEYMKSQSELCSDSLTARGQALRFVNYYEANGWKVGRPAG